MSGPSLAEWRAINDSPTPSPTCPLTSAPQRSTPTMLPTAEAEVRGLLAAMDSSSIQLESSLALAAFRTAIRQPLPDSASTVAGHTRG
jgi:hypothetical protein